MTVCRVQVMNPFQQSAKRVISSARCSVAKCKEAGGNSVKFHHPNIEEFNPRTREGLRSLLEHLCGETIEIGCKQTRDRASCGECQACMNWTVLSERLKLDSLRLED